MPITYSGTITVSGSLQDSLGESGTFSGSIGITLSATLDSGGTGTAAETVKGSVSYQFIDVYGEAGSGTLPFDFSTPSFQFKTGSFQVNEQVPLGLLGQGLGVSLDGGVTLSGAVAIDQRTISENLSVNLSGSYQGVSFTEIASGSGTLFSKLIMLGAAAETIV